MSDFLITKPEEYFYLSNGQSIRSLQELKDALPRLDEGVFRRHVTNEKNDFANWIKGVFQEEELAEEVGQEQDKRKITILLERFIDKKRQSKRQFDDQAIIEKNRADQEAVEKGDFNVLKDRLGEIMKRELEIQKREEKIQQVEEELEKKLSGGEKKFFTKEFIEGVLTGLLIILIVLLVYLKFIAKF